MRRPLAVLVVTSALALAACGGEDDDETTTEATTAPTTTTTEAKLKPAESIEQNGNEWAPLFGAGDDAACDLMVLSAQGACEDIFMIGKPSGFQASFETATVEHIAINGNKAGVRFSNGEAVEMQGFPDGWYVSNIGGNSGEKFFD